MKNLLKNRKVLVALVLGILLIIFNPNETSFKEFLSEDLKKEASSDSEVSGALMDVLSKPAAWIMSLSAKRTNLLFFSIYRVAPGNDEYVYVGILGLFFRIS